SGICLQALGKRTTMAAISIPAAAVHLLPPALPMGRRTEEIMAAISIPAAARVDRANSQAFNGVSAGRKVRMTSLAEAAKGSSNGVLWAELEPHPFQERHRRIRAGRRFVTWSFCERLCEESVRLTAIDPDLAVEAAELAVLVSDLLQVDEPAKARRLYRLRSYAWAHDGNARRVLGDLRGADESVSISEAWGEAGEAAAEELPAYEVALLDLKVSLRIAQRRFPEALSMLDRLFALHTDSRRPELEDPHLAGRSLVKKA